MADVLTIEGDQKAEVVSEVAGVELTADEQDSLQLGESMHQEQEALLAGKYKDAEELESAYIELQKKLGEKGSETSEDAGDTESSQQEETEEETKETKKDSAEVNVLDQLWDETNNGEVSKDLIKKLKKSDPNDIAKMHLEYRKNNQPKQITEKEASQLKNIAGGEEGYTEMVQWAEQNLNEQEVKMFDAVMEKGDPLAAFFAIRSLAYRWEDSRGVDGRVVTGTAPRQNVDQYESQAQVIKDMSDPRYDKDPAYRNKIMKKLERSNVNF